MGSFAAHKGLSTLIKSFNQIAPEYPLATLTLAGQSTLYFPVIRRQIDALSPEIKKRINIVLNFSDKNLPLLIDNCLCLVSPSSQESFGLVLLEAWARFKPVIAADIPASSELIHKSHGGLLFKTGNSLSLTHSLQKILSESETAKKFGANGYQYVKTHSTWDRIGETICTKIFS